MTGADERLREAYARYLASYCAVTPGSPQASALSRARLDLGLLLDALGEDVHPLVRDQMGRDGASLLREAQPLPDQAL
jgi:hypothetical protein